jgi:hypothetical protein
VWSSLTDVAHCPWLLPPAFSETKIDPTVSVELDFREPLRDIVPFLPDLFGGGVIKRGEEYIFQHLWTEAGQSRRTTIPTTHDTQRATRIRIHDTTRHDTTRHDTTRHTHPRVQVSG